MNVNWSIINDPNNAFRVRSARNTFTDDGIVDDSYCGSGNDTEYITCDIKNKSVSELFRFNAIDGNGKYTIQVGNNEDGLSRESRYCNLDPLTRKMHCDSPISENFVLVQNNADEYNLLSHDYKYCHYGTGVDGPKGIICDSTSINETKSNHFNFKISSESNQSDEIQCDSTNESEMTYGNQRVCIPKLKDATNTFTECNVRRINDVYKSCSSVQEQVNRGCNFQECLQNSDNNFNTCAIMNPTCTYTDDPRTNMWSPDDTIVSTNINTFNTVVDNGSCVHDIECANFDNDVKCRNSTCKNIESASNDCTYGSFIDKENRCSTHSVFTNSSKIQHASKFPRYCTPTSNGDVKCNESNIMVDYTIDSDRLISNEQIHGNVITKKCKLVGDKINCDENHATHSDFKFFTTDHKDEHYMMNNDKYCKIQNDEIYCRDMSINFSNDAEYRFHISPFDVFAACPQSMTSYEIYESYNGFVIVEWSHDGTSNTNRPHGFFISIRINRNGEHIYLTRYTSSNKTFIEAQIAMETKWTNNELQRILIPFNFEFVTTNSYKFNYGEFVETLDSQDLKRDDVFEAVVLSYRLVTTTDGDQYNIISSVDVSSPDEMSSCKEISKIMFEVRQTTSNDYNISIEHDNNQPIGASRITTKLKNIGTDEYLMNNWFLSKTYDGDIYTFDKIDATHNVYSIYNDTHGAYCSLNNTIITCTDGNLQDHGKFSVYENDKKLKIFSVRNKLSSSDDSINWPKACHPCNGRIVCDQNDNPSLLEMTDDSRFSSIQQDNADHPPCVDDTQCTHPLRCRMGYCMTKKNAQDACEEDEEDEEDSQKVYVEKFDHHHETRLACVQPCRVSLFAEPEYKGIHTPVSGNVDNVDINPIGSYKLYEHENFNCQLRMYNNDLSSYQTLNNEDDPNVSFDTTTYNNLRIEPTPINDDLVNYTMVVDEGECTHDWQCSSQGAACRKVADDVKKCLTIEAADEACASQGTAMHYNMLSNQCEDMTNCTTVDESWMIQESKTFANPFNNNVDDLYVIRSAHNNNHCTISDNDKIKCNASGVNPNMYNSDMVYSINGSNDLYTITNHDGTKRCDNSSLNYTIQCDSVSDEKFKFISISDPFYVNKYYMLNEDERYCSVQYDDTIQCTHRSIPNTGGQFQIQSVSIDDPTSLPLATGILWNRQYAVYVTTASNHKLYFHDNHEVKDRGSTVFLSYKRLDDAEKYVKLTSPTTGLADEVFIQNFVNQYLEYTGYYKDEIISNLEDKFIWSIRMLNNGKYIFVSKYNNTRLTFYKRGADFGDISTNTQVGQNMGSECTLELQSDYDSIYDVLYRLEIPVNVAVSIRVNGQHNTSLHLHPNLGFGYTISGEIAQSSRRQLLATDLSFTSKSSWVIQKNIEGLYSISNGNWCVFYHSFRKQVIPMYSPSTKVYLWNIERRNDSVYIRDSRTLGYLGVDMRYNLNSIELFSNDYDTPDYITRWSIEE